LTNIDTSEATAEPETSARARRVSASEEFRSWLFTGMMASTRAMPDLIDLISRPSWQKDAACRGQGAERFVLPKGSGEAREAKRICSRCPVTEECLRFALREPGIKGIWAGTSARERDRMRAAARRASVDVPPSSSETSRPSSTPTGTVIALSTR
jgi:WhiB family redox-sensing transcriptional regulator